MGGGLIGSIRAGGASGSDELDGLILANPPALRHNPAQVEA